MIKKLIIALFIMLLVIGQGGNVSANTADVHYEFVGWTSHNPPRLDYHWSRTVPEGYRLWMFEFGSGDTSPINSQHYTSNQTNQLYRKMPDLYYKREYMYVPIEELTSQTYQQLKAKYPINITWEFHPMTETPVKTVHGGLPPIDDDGGGDGGGGNPPTNPPGETDWITNFEMYRVGGEAHLVWDQYPNAVSYRILDNGQIYATTTANTYHVEDGGFYKIQALDSNGNVIAESVNIYVDHYEDEEPDPTDPEQPPNQSCDFCALASMVECPYWDEYMGEWEELMRRVIPPPPNWHEVSNIFANAMVSAFSNYFGNVLEPPTFEQIQQSAQTPLPNLDTSTPVDDFSFNVPSDYNQPLDFDLDNAPVIEIVDESPPFIIRDPLDDLETSGIGVPVFPDDPNNHNGGILDPEGVDGLQTAMPIERQPTAPPTPEPRSSEPPIPESRSGEPPIPDSRTGEPPTPTPKSSEPPIPDKEFDYDHMDMPTPNYNPSDPPIPRGSGN